jgi:hypothetical protein
MKKVKVLILLFGMFAVLYSCTKTENTITPVNFPKNLSINGFNFPEDSMTIYKWLENQDTTEIVNHAWGIWAGLTEPTKQKYNGQNLLVFETWMGVQELAAMSAQGIIAEEGEFKHERTSLSVPKQFLHGRLLGNGPKPIDTNFVVLETVSYDPSAANFVTLNQLFNKSKLESYVVKGGIGKVPEFPNTSITTKPTYYAGVPNKNGLIRVPVWESPNPAKAYKYTQWQKWVYADVNNKQKPNKSLVPVTSSNPSQSEIENATCNVNDFINYKIDRVGADYLNSHQDVGTTPSRQFIEGDYVLLVAMHVTTKEFKNWTWQTYFWSPDPSNPPSPSSKFEAELRPKELKGASSHYAVSTAYAMVWPNQPITGGSDKGTRPIIAFNPYLEGGFGPNVFSLPNTFKPDFVYGMQTNCMSCHALSTFSGKNGYTTNQYIDMRDTSLFNNDVKLDFTWSVQGNINQDK